MRRLIPVVSAGAMLLWLSPSVAAGLDGIRGPTPLTVESSAPPFPTMGTSDRPQPRSFPEQPPTTPHSIDDDYKFGLTDNRCILCHSPSATAEMRALTHAPSISPSHLVLRDGKVANEITPGHRFCASCHVIQTEASPPIGTNVRSLDEPHPQRR
jgi:cytochrome c-type protein NapB